MGSSLRLLAALSIQALVLFVGIIALTAFAGPHKGAAHAAGAASMPAAPAASLPSPRIQVALLLDVSNSMDGLIDQAKAQLWNTVNLLAKATCQGQQPPISFALYEYGRSNNPVAAGYVRQINGFITDLDSLSMNLFSLSTYGGDEYCGQAMLSSLEQLAWDTGSRSYKVIFIAGNESFRQGPVPYTRACEVARQKGVVINTIYCGSREQGIREFWNLGAECGNGSFTHINQDARPEEPPTPYDSVLLALNTRLNGTYIAYGNQGAALQQRQYMADAKNLQLSTSAALNRVAAKSVGRVYNNANWDLVDAAATNPELLEQAASSYWPDSLKSKTPAQVKQIVQQKQQERTNLQKQITDLSTKRQAWLQQHSPRPKEANLQTAMEKAIKEQAGRYGMQW